MGMGCSHISVEPKPETYGLAPGWTCVLMGMMTLVRILPLDKYEGDGADERRPNRENATIAARS